MTVQPTANQIETDQDIETAELDPKSLAAIRDILAIETTKAPEQMRPERQDADSIDADHEDAPVRRKADTAFVPIAPQEASPKSAKAKHPRMTLVRRQADAHSDAHGGPTSMAGAVLAKAKARMLGYRPTAKHVTLTFIVLVVFFRPLLVFGLLILTAFVVTGIFLILGYDGFWCRMMAIARWYARRHPSRSAELHRKLDNFAMKFDAFLDRFPEGTVDGLYLPDFGDLAEVQARNDAALDRRLETLRESEV